MNWPVAAGAFRSRLNDREWDKLINLIAEGNVVPVIGPELLVDDDPSGNPARLYDVWDQVLGEQADLAPPAPGMPAPLLFGITNQLSQVAAGQPATGSDQTHRRTKRYDDRDNVARRDFFDTAGRLTVGAGEYAAEEWDHDARGKETRVTYLGPDGQPLMQPAGYAIRRAYTPAGLETRTDYLDDHGGPALSNAGSCSLVCEYDEAGRLRTQIWVVIPGQTAEATAVRTYRDGLAVLMCYRTVGDQLVNSAYGYAREDKNHNEAGSLRRVAYHDAAGAPVYGPYGYASAEIASKVITYYDPAGRALDDNSRRTTRPLVYITFLRPADCAALRAGLQPGDLLWQIGTFSLPQAIAERWDEPRAAEEAQNAILEACRAALAPTNAGPVHTAVLRDEHLIEFNLPEIPATGLGVHVDTRLVPASEYEAMVTRYRVKP